MYTVDKAPEDDSTRAFRDGDRAALTGEPKSSNPYGRDDPRSSSWEAGFDCTAAARARRELEDLENRGPRAAGAFMTRAAG